MDSESLIKKIEYVLKGNLTPYKIAKEVGYSSAHQIHKLIRNESKIVHMTLEKAIAFEELYEKQYCLEKEKES